MNDRLPATTETQRGALTALSPRANFYIGKSKAAGTKRAYKFAWAAFSGWCEQQGVQSLPATEDTIVEYVTAMADLKRSYGTICKHLAAISVAHQTLGMERGRTPTSSLKVRLAMQGIARTIGAEPNRQVEPIMTADIRAMLTRVPANLRGIRDRALLLVGFSGAFRRSELTSITYDSLEFTNDGMKVKLRRTKTSQTKSRTVGIPFGHHEETCPIRALKRWLEAAEIMEGPVFRAVSRHGKVGATRLNDETVVRTIKHYVALTGLDSKRFAGHSLRSGCLSEAHMNGASPVALMNHSGHASYNMLKRYVRGNIIKESAAKSLGL